MKRLLIASIVAMTLTGGVACAQDAFQTPKAGTIKLDVRLTGIVPDESGSIRTAAGAATGLNVKVNDSFVPTIGLEYYVNPSLSLELIAGSGNHKVKAVGGATNVEVLELWHVPPTLTAKYHFAPDARVSPYVGAGLTYIWFASEDGKNGFNVDLKDDFGYALQVGADIATSGPWSVNLDLKHIAFETDANINFGALKSKVTLDPWVASVGIGYKF
ncbi:OmpW family outer membrane protein [Aquidulcibacter sp.]|uniref:OmpW/AlkL family protein n=1 Tax=Aquidulcibacter sp. TaxID=2052990 RepID=UPI0025BBAE0C|nr:OmpW family outer membrane protein [Aquidulcibacter sp.]MCA3693986.1 outer membrane beta-barrel protein [Aquidulcibacter sp.]